MFASCSNPVISNIEDFNSSARGMGDTWPTQIHIQNNTSLEWNVSAEQTGSHKMDNDEWWSNTSPIEPWEKNKVVLGTNRDNGIHYNKTFYLTVTLENGGESVYLKMKLKGKTVNSTLWHSAAGPDFNHDWKSDRNWHSQDFSINGKEFILKYKSYFTGWLDDLIYVIHEKDPFPAEVSIESNKFNVLAYNIYMLAGVLGKDQDLRGKYIPEACKGYDAVVFSEAFDNNARDNLISAMKTEYPYSTSILNQDWSLEDGGVIILSRWPIVKEAQHVFTEGTNEDKLAAKGVKYAAINKNGAVYNLFGTHTQAWNETKEQVDIRTSQLVEIRNFAESCNIPADEAVIVAGDLNVDMYKNAWNEYDQMYQSLGALVPTSLSNFPTYDKNTNTYASGYTEYLDYVLVLDGWKQPVENFNEVRIFRSCASDMEDKWDLSDHYGIAGLLSF